MKKLIVLLLSLAMVMSLVACGSSNEGASNDEPVNADVVDKVETPDVQEEVNAVYEDVVLVEPDSDQDFDTFEMTITYAVENGRLVSVDFSSEDWGRPALKKNAANARYCNKAIVTICTELINGKTEAEIDAVSGATCTSVSFKDSLKDIETNGQIQWKSVSPDLVFTIDGAELSEEEVQELLNADLEAEEAAEQAAENGGQGSGKGNNKGGKGSSMELPEGCGITAEFNGRNENGWLQVNMISTLPEGYVIEGINVIRVGNTAYPFAKDPEACAVLFDFNVETLVLALNVDSEYMTSNTLSVSIKVAHGEESGNVTVELDTTGK